jgi:hypothetical protein
MKQTPFKGWAVFSRNEQEEWPLHFTVQVSSDEAARAYVDYLMLNGMSMGDARDLYKQRLADGSIRVGRVVVQAEGEG